MPGSKKSLFSEIKAPAEDLVDDQLLSSSKGSIPEGFPNGNRAGGSMPAVESFETDSDMDEDIMDLERSSQLPNGSSSTITFTCTSSPSWTPLSLALLRRCPGANLLANLRASLASTIGPMPEDALLDEVALGKWQDAHLANIFAEVSSTPPSGLTSSPRKPSAPRKRKLSKTAL